MNRKRGDTPNNPKTCFTCEFFSLREYSLCSEGTCGEASRISCDKKHYDGTPLYEESEAEKCILKAMRCADYKPAGKL